MDKDRVRLDGFYTGTSTEVLGVLISKLLLSIFQVLCASCTLIWNILY